MNRWGPAAGRRLRGAPGEAVSRRTAGHAAPSPAFRALRAALDHFLIAGPLLGLLSALYAYHLQRVAPWTPDPAAQAVLQRAVMFHGHFVRHYYITPAQNALWWALAAPAMLWLVVMLATLTVLGIRLHLRRPERH